MDLTRREFLATSLTASGGMLISFHIPALSKSKPFEPFATQSDEINAWLTIEPDNTITIRVAQSEMGQGVFTAMPMIIADELEADWRTIRAEYADVNRSIKQGKIYQRMSTNSSAAVRTSLPYLQQAGAQAREKLLRAAASRWRANVADCYADYGKIHHKPTVRSISYGELAADASKISVANIKVKTPEQFSLLGVATKRLDTPAKVNGSAVFGMDIRIEGMVYASVIHCPVIGGRVRSSRFNAIRNMSGVLQMVRMNNSIAVVAKTFWQAKMAADKLPVQWDIGPAAKTYSETFRKEYVTALEKEGVLVDKSGDALSALEHSERTIESDYVVPYLAHACMEPLNCTVSIGENRVDIWAGVQDPESALQAVADIVDLPLQQIYLHNCFLGGGFGRRSNVDFIKEAALIAKEVASTVQMIWTREEDTRAGQYRPMSAIKFKAGLDIDKNIVAYSNHSVTHSIMKDMGVPVSKGIDRSSLEGLVNMPYAIPHKRITHTIKNTHVSTWFWRAGGNSQNVFAMECFVDEMAQAAKMDPLSFRKRYLAHRPDLVNVLEELAERSNWNNRLSNGLARGMAIHESAGTIVGQVAEVLVKDNGEVKVQRIVSVIDCGNLVNPLSAEMQIESGIIFGLTAALFGKITIEKGRVLEDNLDTYRMLSMGETPLMETHWLLSGGDKWGGLGEPGLPCVAPAVVNAVYHITRRRIRSLPLSDYFLQRG